MCLQSLLQADRSTLLPSPFNHEILYPPKNLPCILTKFSIVFYESTPYGLTLKNGNFEKDFKKIINVSFYLFKVVKQKHIKELENYI